MPDLFVSVCRWDEAKNGSMDERVIRAMHVPRNMHRVSLARYPRDARFRTTTRAGLVYVLGGRCEYMRGKAHAEMGKGEFAKVPAGTYDVRVIGEAELVIVKAWALPFVIPPSV